MEKFKWKDEEYLIFRSRKEYQHWVLQAFGDWANFKETLGLENKEDLFDVWFFIVHNRVYVLEVTAEMKEWALRGSIKKWESIRDGIGVDAFCTNCKCCLISASDFCWECPIAEFTGKSGCSTTPYTEWFSHQTDCHNRIYAGKPLMALCPECRRIAEEEVKFLQEVLEKIQGK